MLQRTILTRVALISLKRGLLKMVRLSTKGTIVMYDEEALEHMVGATCHGVENLDNEELLFHTDRGTFRFYHQQDCCESVVLEDTGGDIDEFRGRINRAEVSTNSGNSAHGHETWTFYRMDSKYGFLCLRWRGESNGYYSEEITVELEQ